MPRKRRIQFITKSSTVLENLTIQTGDELILSIDGQEYRTTNLIQVNVLRNIISQWLNQSRRKINDKIE